MTISSYIYHIKPSKKHLTRGFCNFGAKLCPTRKYFGIGGRIKSFIEDFEVTEVDVKGRRANITSVDIPPPPAVDEEQQKRLANVRECFTRGFQSADYDRLEERIGVDAWARLCCVETGQSPVHLLTVKSKAKAIEIRGALAKCFPELETTRARRQDDDGNVTHELYVASDKNYVPYRNIFSHEDTSRLLEFQKRAHMRAPDEELVLHVENAEVKITQLQLLHNTFIIRHSPGSDEIGIKFKERTMSHNQRKHLPFIECILEKRGLETYRLIKEFETKLGLRRRSIQTAGIKDTKAVTRQFITFRSTTPEEILRATSDMKNVGIGNFTYVEDALRPGKLSGNHFNIVIRNPDTDKDFCADALKCIKEDGFINYFGEQRFGDSCEELGKALLKRDWVLALSLWLKPPDVPREVWLESFSDVVNQTRELSEAPKPTLKTEFRDRAFQVLKEKGITPEVCFDLFHTFPSLQSAMLIQSFVSSGWNELVSQELGEDSRPQLSNFHISSTCGTPVLAESSHSIGELAFPFFGTSIAENSRVKEFWRPWLDRNELTASDFDFSDVKFRDINYVQKIFGTGLHGWFRPMKVFPEELEHEWFEDEFGCHLRLKFYLPKGSYATVLLKGLMQKQG